MHRNHACCFSRQTFAEPCLVWLSGIGGKSCVGTGHANPAAAALGPCGVALVPWQVFPSGMWKGRGGHLAAAS